MILAALVAASSANSTWLMSPMGAGGQVGGAAGPPPTCAGVLDLSTGCAQLVAFGGLF